VRVRYRFRGARTELEQTFPLGPNEVKVAGGVITTRRLGIMGGAGLAMLTNERLCILAHYAFKPDEAWEMPRGSLVEIRPIRVPTITFFRLTYRSAEGPQSVDIADVQVRTGATLMMGSELSTHGLFESIRQTWGEEAPSFLV
jgi:hypothetical protein